MPCHPENDEKQKKCVKMEDFEIIFATFIHLSIISRLDISAKCERKNNIDLQYLKTSTQLFLREEVQKKRTHYSCKNSFISLV